MSFVSIFSAVGIRIFVMAFIWTILDCIAGCNFWKSLFFCRYNAIFLFKTNRT
jgi:hypothetical protein